MLNYTVDADGIATLEWDYPGKSQNILNEASLTTFVRGLPHGAGGLLCPWPAGLLGEEGFHRRR
jgi:hypothetical protein